MSLKLHGVTVSIQDMNTVLGLFLQGEKEKIEQVYWSFYNHMATDGEIEEWSDTCALFWVHGNGDPIVAHAKLNRALVFMALGEILNSEQTKGTNPFNRAMEIAEQRLAAMDRVRWYIPVPELADFYAMGDSVKAEKSTGNWDQDELVGVLGRNSETDEGAFAPKLPVGFDEPPENKAETDICKGLRNKNK
jgi:hypothetical protein